MYFQIAHPFALFFGVPLFALFCAWSIIWKKGFVYKYSLTNYLSKKITLLVSIKKFVPLALRLATIFLLILLASRPQFVDVKSNLNVDGIDIMIDIDVSGSMNLCDDMKDPRRRIVVAKDEAKSFVQKRKNDQLGISIFGQEALTIVPITMDKEMILEAIDKLDLGIVNQNLTAIGKGLMCTIARLRGSNAKSKVIILLTDGQSNDPQDYPIDRAIKIAQEYNIKIYCMGIGSLQPFLIDHYGIPHHAGSADFDEALLKKISDQTKGKYFWIKNPQDMRKAYEEIDSLEKRTVTTNMFHKYQDLFWPIMQAVLLCFCAELFISTFFWKLIS